MTSHACLTIQKSIKSGEKSASKTLKVRFDFK